jgi:hypothetical protein
MSPDCSTTPNNLDRQIEASEKAQQAWVRTIREMNEPRRTYLMHCTPGYFNGQGDAARAFLGETYGRGEIEFWKLIDAWWKTGTFEGLEFTP